MTFVQTLSVKIKDIPLNSIVSVYYQKDIMDILGTGELKVPYQAGLENSLTPGLEPVEISGGIGTGRLFHGRINKATREGNFFKIELQDYGVRFKKDCSTDYQNERLEDVLTKLIKEINFTPLLKNISQTTLDAKISKTQTTETSANSSNASSATSGTICGSFMPTGVREPSGVSYGTWYNTCWVNYCPLCGVSGKLADNPKNADGGEVSCTACGADYSGVSGWEKMPSPRAQLTCISGPELGTAGTVATGASGSGSSTFTPTTYEDVINSICADNNLYMYIDSNENCVVQEFTGVQNPEYHITKEMVERDTYQVINGVINSTKKVTVTFKNGGKTSLTLPGATNITAEQEQTYDRQDLDQKGAEDYAKKMLYQTLREQDYKFGVNVLTHPEIFPGKWVDLPDITDTSKTVTKYVCGATINIEGNDVLQSSITLKDAPPEPEIGGSSSGSGSLASLQQIGQAGARFAYSHSCSDEGCLESTGSGDCYAMSDWLYDKLCAAGVKAQILWQSGPTNHRWVQIYANGTWTDFPYDQYNFAKNFRVTSTHSGVRVYKNSC